MKIKKVMHVEEKYVVEGICCKEMLMNLYPDDYYDKGENYPPTLDLMNDSIWVRSYYMYDGGGHVLRLRFCPFCGEKIE